MGQSAGASEGGSNIMPMRIPSADLRYRAVSMELAAYLDARHVEMHILTDTGTTISIICPRDSIFAVQKHIEEMGQACPEIATWSHQYRAELTRRANPHFASSNGVTHA
jgi:hypothetical protein